MITFKQAEFRTNTIIKHRIGNEYKNTNAPFAELNPLHENDIETLQEMYKKWDFGGYVGNILLRAKAAVRYGKAYEKFYNLTLQQTNFEKLSSENVLGTTLLRPLSESLKEITYFQTNPKYTRKVENAEYKHIGKSMFDALKELFPHADFELEPVCSAIKFWESLGFKKLKDSTRMRYFAKK